MHHLIEKADATYVFDNEAICRMASSMLYYVFSPQINSLTLRKSARTHYYLVGRRAFTLTCSSERDLFYKLIFTWIF